jgi:hypothetical protein
LGLPLKIPTLLIHNAFKSIPRALNISTHLAYVEKSKVDTSWAEIDKMLSVIPADISREQWLSVAMGIHHFDYLSSEKLGYSKFLEWSKTGEDSFKGERG